ncbi:hypothetical protein LQW54_010925 [Pestalotiopsis sp. IQ-011]
MSITPEQSADAPSAPGPSPTPRFSCAICNSKQTKTCAGCKSTAYCGKACQKEDWRCHKLLCSSLAQSALETERPADSIRAVFFPADGDRPVLHYFPQVRGWVEGLYDEVAALFAAHEKPEVQRRLRDDEREDTLGPAVEVWWRAHPESNVNKAVKAAAGGKRTRQPWTGSVLMVAMTYSKRREERLDQTYKDMTLRDFRDAVDWLVDFEDPLRMMAGFADATDRAMQDVANQHESTEAQRAAAASVREITGQPEFMNMRDTWFDDRWRTKY